MKSFTRCFRLFIVLAGLCALVAPVLSHAATTPTEKKTTPLDGVIALLKEARTSDHPEALLDKANVLLDKELKKTAKSDKEKSVQEHCEKASKALADAIADTKATPVDKVKMNEDIDHAESLVKIANETLTTPSR